MAFPWKKVLHSCGMTPRTVDKAKLFHYLETELDEWLATRPATTAVAHVDPAFAVSAPKILHDIMRTCKDRIKLEGLVMAYAIRSESDLDPESLDYIRGQLKTFLARDPHYHLSRGPIPTVYRLTDAKGKETHVEIAEPTPPTGTVQRYSGKVRELVPSEAKFRELKHKYGDKLTVEKIREELTHM